MQLEILKPPMHKTNLHNTSSLRFRRWSRVGYAVFCSLACSVSIGTLAVSISDKTLQKSAGSKSSNAIFALSSMEDESKDSDEKLDLEATLQQNQTTSFVQITVYNAAACSQNNYNIIHRNG